MPDLPFDYLAKKGCQALEGGRFAASELPKSHTERIYPCSDKTQQFVKLAVYSGLAVLHTVLVGSNSKNKRTTCQLQSQMLAGQESNGIFCGQCCGAILHPVHVFHKPVPKCTNISTDSFEKI